MSGLENGIFTHAFVWKFSNNFIGNKISLQQKYILTEFKIWIKFPVKSDGAGPGIPSLFQVEWL